MTKRKPGAVRGRPKGSAKFTERILLPLDPDLLEAIDEMANEREISRAEMIRELASLGLKTVKRRKARAKRTKS